MARNVMPANIDSDSTQDPQSPLRIVAGVAFTMAAYAIGLKAARGVGFRANLGLGRAAVNLTKKGGLLSGLRRIATKHGYNRAAKRMNYASRSIQNWAAQVRQSDVGDLASMQEHLQSTRGFTQKLFTRAAEDGTKVHDYRITSLLGKSKVLKNSKITKWFRDGAKYDKDFLDAPRNVRLNVFGGLRKDLSPAQLRKARFGGSDFGKVMQARAHRWGTEFLSAAPVMYAVDKARGFDEQRKWYNPASMGAWMMEMGPIDLGMQALMPIASGVSGTIGRVAMKGIGRRGAENIVASTLRFGESIDKGVHNLSGAFTKAVHAARANAERSTYRKPIRTVTNLAKNAAIFGKTFGSSITNLTKHSPEIKRKTQLDKALDQLASIKNTAAKEMGTNNMDFSPIRDATLRKFKDKPTGFSSFVNKMLSLADEQSSMIKHTKERLGDGQVLYRGKGSLRFKGTDYQFSSIHPQSIANNFAKFMQKGPGLLGIKQLGHLMQKDKADLVYGGQEINLGIGYRPEQVTAAAFNSESHFGDLAFYIEGLTGKNISKQRENILGNLTKGKYKLRSNEASVYIDERLYLLRNTEGSVSINRMGFAPNEGAYLKYGAVPTTDMGNFSRVNSKFFGQMMANASGDRDKAYGFSQTTMKEKHAGFFELGSKQRKTGFRALFDMFSGNRWTDLANERVLMSDEGVFNPDFVGKIMASRDIEAGTLLKTYSGVGKKFEAAINNSLFKQGRSVEKVIRDYDLSTLDATGKQVKLKLGDFLVDHNKDITPEAIQAKVSMANHFIKEDDMVNQEVRTAINTLKRVNETNIGQLSTPVRKVSGYGKMNSYDTYNMVVMRKLLDQADGSADKFVDHLLKKGAIQRNSKHHRLVQGMGILSKFDQLDPYAESFIINAKKKAVEFTGVINQHKETMTEFAKTIDPILNTNTHNNNVRLGRPLDSTNLFVVRNQAERIIGDQIENVNVAKHFAGAFGARENVTGSDDLFGSYSTNNPKSYLTASAILSHNAADVVNDTANFIGMGFEENSIRGFGDLASKMLFKRVLPVAALGVAWNAADTFTDESQLFEGTALGEGLNVFAASQVARVRLGAQNIIDKTGVGAVARYMEDLMPGSVSSPLSGAVRGLGSPIAGLSIGFKMGGPTGAMIGGAIGATVGVLSGGGPLGLLGQWDISKSRNELLDEYSGRKDVAIKRGRFWLFGSTNVEGNSIDYYGKNWYAEMRAQARYTPTLFGSKTERLLAPLDAHHYAEKHYWSRPYLETGSPFENIPLFGKMVPFGNDKMHEEDYKYLGLNAPIGTNDFTGMGRDASFQLDVLSQNGPGQMSSLQSGFGQHVGTMPTMSKTSPDAIMQSTMLAAEELTGLRGWMFSLGREGITGKKSPWEDTALVRTAQEMTSPARDYWDNQLGDMMGMNEIVRRFIKHDPAWMMKAGSGLPNTMPSWMPKEFQTGDPYTRIKKGESRLPGQGYVAGHNVDFTMPFDADMFGMSFSDQVDNFTGERLPVTEAERYERVSKSIKDTIAESLSAANHPVEQDVNFFNPNMNISGTADLVKMIGGRKHLMNVKVVGSDTFSDISGQVGKDTAALNATLVLAKQMSGSLMYVNAETGETKTVGVSADPSSYYNEIGQLNAARATAMETLGKGISPNMDLGNAFSRVDRLKVLADVSPYSSEFYNTKQQVEQMARTGLLSDDEIQKANTALDQRENVLKQFDFDKNRFYNVGTAVTDAERLRQQEIQREYNFVERSVGATWEYMSNELFSPIHTKFMGETTALERYKRTQVYGKEIKLWDQPYNDFIRPFKNQFMGNDDMVQGAMMGMIPGLMFGPAGGLVAGMGGMAVAGLNHVTGGGIPEYKQRERDIVEQMDALEYTKYSKLFEATGDVSALRSMQKTMMSTNSDPRASFGQKMAALPRNERAYFRAFVDSGTDEERNEILQMVPDYMKGMLINEWNKKGTDAMYAKTGGVPVRNIPATPQPGMDPWLLTQNPDDLVVRAFRSEGLDARDMGLGFYKQSQRMRMEERQQAKAGSVLGPDIRSALAVASGSNSITIMNNSGGNTVVSFEVG